MTAPAIRPRFLARLLSLLAAVMLVAAPLSSLGIPSPAMAMPMDCCPDAPCRDLDKSMCPQACAVACTAIPAPAETLAEPFALDAASPEPTALPRLIGRAIQPESPPPR